VVEMVDSIEPTATILGLLPPQKKPSKGKITATTNKIKFQIPKQLVVVKSTYKSG
jgi:hypothetical protein